MNKIDDFLVIYFVKAFAKSGFLPVFWLSSFLIAGGSGVDEGV